MSRNLYILRIIIGLDSRENRRPPKHRLRQVETEFGIDPREHFADALGGLAEDEKC